MAKTNCDFCTRRDRVLGGTTAQGSQMQTAMEYREATGHWPACPDRPTASTPSPEAPEVEGERVRCLGLTGKVVDEYARQTGDVLNEVVLLEAISAAGLFDATTPQSEGALEDALAPFLHAEPQKNLPVPMRCGETGELQRSYLAPKDFENLRRALQHNEGETP